MNITQNEQKVLKHLVDDGRATDIEIAKKLNISSQAVGKIRKKMEAEHLIVGYEAKLSLEKLGVTTYIVAAITPTPALWEEFGDEKFFSRLENNPYVIGVFQASNKIILVGAFRSQKELDIFVNQATKKYGKYFGDLDIKIFSNYGFKKLSTKKLLKYFIDSIGQPKRLYPFTGEKEGILFED